MFFREEYDRHGTCLFITDHFSQYSTRGLVNSEFVGLFCVTCMYNNISVSNCLLLMVGNNSSQTHNNYQTVKSLKINIKTLSSMSYVLRFWNVKDDVCVMCVLNLKFCVMISLSYPKMSNQKVIAFCDLNQCHFYGFLWFFTCHITASDIHIS